MPAAEPHREPARPTPLAVALARCGPLESAEDVVAAARRLLEGGQLGLPLPGAGHTAGRHDALAEIAACDLSLARICEGHVDAIAILAEAGGTPLPGLYGVWAADHGDRPLTAHRSPGGWMLRGAKRYASGARWLDRALVTARTERGGGLFDADLTSAAVRPIADTWQAVGMAATESLDVAFDTVSLPVAAQIGQPGFYLQRRGFWHGAIDVAACWYGGALGAFRMLRDRLAGVTATDHQRAHLGAIAAACDMMRMALHAAAAEIDASGSADPDGYRRALVVRHLVEQACQDVLARVGRAGGTAPLVFERAHARRAADLVVYLRQHHAERDLAELGGLVLGAR